MSFICTEQFTFCSEKSKMPFKKYMCVTFVMSLNVVKVLKVAKHAYIYTKHGSSKGLSILKFLFQMSHTFPPFLPVVIVSHFM